MLNRLIKKGARLRPVWLVIWLLGLAAVFLAPAIQTGYWAEDLYQSMMPRGISVLDDKSLFAVASDHVKHTIANGRFFPLTPVLITTVHYVFHEAWVYKTYIVIMGILDVLLFYQLVSRLSGRRDYACFAACLTIGLIQYRVAIDPSLGFFGQMQLLIALLFLSLLALRRYLEGGSWRWLAASSALYFCCTLMYEIAYTLVFLHTCLILQASGSWARKVRTGLPFFSSAGFCALATIVVRRMYPSDAYWQHPSLDLRAVALAIVHQTSAGFPLSYFLFDPLDIFPGAGQSGLIRWIFSGRTALVALSAFGLSFLCLRRERATSGERPAEGVGSGWLAALGLILAVFPTFMISISPYHRANLSFGVGWIPVLIQDYGVGILLSLGLWKAVEATAGGGSKAAWKCVAASVLVGSMMGVTDRANREVVRCFNATPGSKLYRDAVRQAGGTWQNQRLLLESAFNSGLLELVPAHSTVIYAREYPYWYDSTYSRYFYAAYAGKSLETARPGVDPMKPEAYRVRDVLLGREAGYVILSGGGPEVSKEPDGTRIYLRHPELFRPGNLARFGVESQSGETPRVALEELRVIKSGRDWAIFSLGALEKSVPPDSLRVVLDTPPAPSALAGERPGIIQRR
jgi:hypothetical protein